MSEPWLPHDFQLKGVELGLKQNAKGILFNPGWGKTSVVLKILQILKESKQMKRALVIAPLRVCQLVWPEEIAKWSDFEGMTYRMLHGDPKKRERMLEERPDIFAINPEGLQWLLGDKKRFQKLGADILVVDESTTFKHSNTKRFKLLKPFLPYFKRRYIMTGTPSPNGLLDLFGQVYLLDLGAALSPYVTHYRATYFFCRDRFGWNWTLNPGADKLIHKQIAHLMYRPDVKDFKEPIAQDNVIRVELPPKARKIYDELETQLITTLEKTKIVTAVNLGVVTGKCAQIANGGIYYHPQDEIVDVIAPKFYTPDRQSFVVHNAKTEALRELIDELSGSPLLVGYEYEHDLERIKAEFGKDVPVIGEIPMKRLQGFVADWNAGRIPFMFGHPAAMGHGLNLQFSGNNVCWYSIPWDLELYDQFIRRIRRQGQKAEQVFVHHIVAKDTIDEVKMRALKRKIKTQQGLLDALRDYTDTRKSLETKGR